MMLHDNAWKSAILLATQSSKVKGVISVAERVNLENSLIGPINKTEPFDLCTAMIFERANREAEKELSRTSGKQ